MRCKFCNLIHDQNKICPLNNRRDALHKSIPIDEFVTPRIPNYGQRLADGFRFSEDENYRDKFGRIYNSGNYK